MQFIDEDDRVLILHQLLHDRLQPLFKLPAILGARHNQRQVQSQHFLVGQKAGHFAIGNPLRKPFHNRSLAHARLANQYRIVLRAPAQNLNHALQFPIASHKRIELSVHRRLRKIAAELGQQARLALPLLWRSLLLRHARQLFANLRQLQTALLQNLGRKALFFAQQAQEQMFSPNVLVPQPFGFFRRVGQHTLALVGKRQVNRG